MGLAKDGKMTLAPTAHTPALADKAFAASGEMLAMRDNILAI
jgi:hypothetical protein